jgi:hypothetical protein
MIKRSLLLCANCASHRRARRDACPSSFPVVWRSTCETLATRRKEQRVGSPRRGLVQIGRSAVDGRGGPSGVTMDGIGRWASSPRWPPAYGSSCSGQATPACRREFGSAISWARTRSPEVSLRRRSHCASSRRWPTTPRSTISTPRAGRRAGQPRVGQPGAESRPGGGRRVDDRGRRGAAGRRAAGGVRGHVPPRPRCVPSQRFGDRRCCCRLDAVGVALPTRATRGCCRRCRDRCRAEVLEKPYFPRLQAFLGSRLVPQQVQLHC